MDNFLYNLRNGSNKRDQFRRHHNSHQNGGNERFNKNSRPESNKQPFMSSEQSMALLHEGVQIIRDYLESSIECQKKTVQIAERKIQTEELRVGALQSIARTLEEMSGAKTGTPRAYRQGNGPLKKEGKDLSSVMEMTQELIRSQKKRTVDENGDISSGQSDHCALSDSQQPAAKKATSEDKAKIIQVIKDLRNNNVPFKEVAQYFESNGIPTFSGKGRWFASTVANILKSENKKLAYAQQV